MSPYFFVVSNCSVKTARNCLLPTFDCVRAASQHGTDILSRVDAVGFTAVDSIRFHTFRSLVIVFGGNSQNPHDTDRDGSIGDPVQGTSNREGIFDLAQGLYDSGWDVLAFDEEVVDDNDDIPFTEAKNSTQRLVSPEFGGDVSIMGYSQGGGVVQKLIQRELTPDGAQYIPIYGVYLDAVSHDVGVAEDDWPDSVVYLLNIYQTLPLELGGADIDNTEVTPPAVLEEINTTTTVGWNASLGHSEIDDNLQVQQRILLRLNQLLSR